MATNEILVFAGDPGANVDTQAAYDADPQRGSGNVPGVARSAFVNKALLQSTLIAAAVGQFMADYQPNDINDQEDVAVLAGYLADAVGALGSIPSVVSGGTANALTADFSPDVALENGTTVVVRANAANTTTTPTIAVDGAAAKTITKQGSTALAAGDIKGAGHWLILSLDTALDKWVLGNPATGSGATGAGGDLIFWENDQTITANYTLTASKNAMTAGPVTINTGVTVTVPTGQTWSVV